MTWPLPTLILQEAGCVVSDAAGRPAVRQAPARLRHELPDVGGGIRQPTALHEAILAEVARGMEAFAAAGPPTAAAHRPPPAAAGGAAVDPASTEAA